MRLTSLLSPPPPPPPSLSGSFSRGFGNILRGRESHFLCSVASFSQYRGRERLPGRASPSHVSATAVVARLHTMWSWNKNCVIFQKNSWMCGFSGGGAVLKDACCPQSSQLCHLAFLSPKIQKEQCFSNAKIFKRNAFASMSVPLTLTAFCQIRRHGAREGDRSESGRR